MFRINISVVRFIRMFDLFIEVYTMSDAKCLAYTLILSPSINIVGTVRWVVWVGVAGCCALVADALQYCRCVAEWTPPLLSPHSADNNLT